MKVADYERLVLDSADESGALKPPPLSDWWQQQSVLMGMYIRGLIERRGEGRMWNRTGPWYASSAAADTKAPDA